MSFKGFFGNWIVKNLLSAVLAVVLLIAGAGLLLKVLTRHNEEIRVPDFSNMTVDEAAAAARAHDVKIDVTDSVYIKRMARGTVYRQIPEAGSMVKKGRRVALTINSVLPKKITMPNLVGYSMRQAKAELSSRGLNLGRLIYVENIATNNVLKQIYAMAAEINRLLIELFAQVNVTLVDFKMEFGYTSDGQIVLADEISPDTSRLWDKTTGERLDRDRFRRDMGHIREAYGEILSRLERVVKK